MQEFVTWEIIGTYAGAVMIVGLITQLLKYFPIVEKLPAQGLSYVISFILLTTSQFALGTFTWQLLGLNLINAVIISLASNGAYSAMTKVITSQEARIEKEEKLEEISEGPLPDEGQTV